MPEAHTNDPTSFKEGEEVQVTVDLDSILVNELNQFGKFQVRLTLMCAVAAIFSAWAFSEYLFTTARIKTRCLIPECDSSSPEFHPSWIYNAIPGAPDSLNSCQRFVRNSSQSPGDLSCPSSLFARNRVEDCEEYVYENRGTIVYDFGLACDEWRRTLIGSLRTIGSLMSLPLTGYISDRWGRRTALALAGFNGAWLGASRYFAKSYVGFVILQIIEATIGNGLYTSTFILFLEVLGTKYRTLAGTFIITFWATGHMTLGLIAWGVPNWRNLTLTIFIPQLLTIAFYWIMPESVRWYISMGRFKDAKATIQKMAETNGKRIRFKPVEALQQSVENRRENHMLEKQEKSNEPWLIVLVFRHRKIFLRCVLTSIWWITTILIYYGLSINAVNMTGNPYLKYVVVSAVEIPGFWIAVLLMDKIGRRIVLAGGFWTCAACQVAYIYISYDCYSLSLTFYFVGKCAIAAVCSVLYIYTAELYPTKHRHTLFAFSSMMGRIGSFVAPLTPAIATSTFEEFPFVLFGSLAVLSGALVFLTPETQGSKLPDTMEDAENL